MRARGPTNASSPNDLLSEERNQWVNVTWMPHASLSQASHVCLAVRSVLTCLDELKHYEPEEWQVRATIHGLAGVSIVPIASITPTAPVTPFINALDSQPTSNLTDKGWLPMASGVTHICKLDALLHIPLRWRDLPRDAYLRFEVVQHCEEILYVATIPMFSAYGKLHTGLMRIELRSPMLDIEMQQNAGLLPPPRKHHLSAWQDGDKIWKASRMLDQLERFEEVKVDPTSRVPTNKAFGEIQPVPWLDALAKQYCYNTLNEARESAMQSFALEDSGKLGYMIIEFPVFDVPVMHEETFYPVPQNGPSGAVTPLDLALHKKKTAKSSRQFHPLQTIPFLDNEDENDNPVEDKYRTLAHDLLRGLVDPALKPDRVQRDRLAAIIASPSHHPSREDKDLLWRFRFSLVDNRRALTKFLLAVDWTVESEVVQAAELLEQWRKRSPIEVTDALKLLGKQVAYQTNLVRAYAIDTLAAAPDEELSLYLLQLVQALKFENIQETGVNQVSSIPTRVSSLASFLIGRAAKNIQLANYLYWYLKVELQDPTHGARYREIFAELQDRLSKTAFSSLLPESNASGNGTSATAAESGSDTITAPFKSFVDSAKKISSTLRGAEASPKSPEPASSRKPSKTLWEVLSEQDHFLSGIMDAQLSYGSKSKKDAKEAHLRTTLAKEGFDRSTKRDPLPLPCAPEVMVTGVNPQTAKVFKSAVYPALIEFYVDSIADKTDFGQSRNRALSAGQESPSSHALHQRTSYRAMIKTGDDLRQDQLAMMFIKLMDGLLKRASLDMCLTPYSIIATSPTSGMIEFVEQSQPVSQILASNNNSILQFLQANAPQKGAKYDVRPEIMSNYIRSCAGYCVITYLLGVGDRHLDNLMITNNGNFFHIDFGFMFGRDPKPLPPAFRLTREMVEGMGGLDSTEYRQFCSLACQAFNALRKSAGLVLNLLHLMSDAGIEDLSNNPSADAEGVIAKVEERFRLELTDEQAERFFLNLINDCLVAIAPRLMDVFHSIAVARR